MRFYKKNLRFTILLLVILLPFSPGCSNILRRPGEKQSKQTQEQKKSPPKTLTSLENITETMIKDIQSVEDKRLEETQQKEQNKTQDKANEKDKTKEEDKPQEKEKPDEGDKAKGKKTGEEQQKGKDESPNKGQKPPEKQAKPTAIDWKKMQKNAEKLQSTWSDYINTALKDGASKDLVKDYGNELDILTTKVMEQQEESLLSTANDLSKYYPKFFDLYKHQAPPNIKDMKYHIRKIIIYSEKGQWSQSPASIDAIKQAWDTAKSRMEKPDRDLNKKIESAMDSFSRSVREENKFLVKMKGDILIKSLEEIK